MRTVGVQVRWIALLGALIILPFACDGRSGGGGGGFTLDDQISVSVSPKTIIFDVVAINMSDTRTVTIENTSAKGTLVVSSVALTGGSSEDFSVAEWAKKELLPGETVDVVITYTPSDNRPDEGTLVIQHNATGDQEDEVSISALAQVAALYFQPSPVAFGPVRATDFADKQVRIFNGGADWAELTGLTWSLNSSGDYDIVEEPPYPTRLEPGDEVFFTVRYTPEGGNVDSGEVFAIYNTTSEDGSTIQEEAGVRVTGQEVVPDILISPGAVDFGWVALDTPLVRPVSITNEGSDTLLVQPMVLEPEHVALELEGIPEEGTALEPGDSMGFNVRFHATAAFPLTTDPISGIRVLSNDPDEAVELVPIFARIEAPSIRVTPEDVVDFGVVARNFTAERTLTILNAGHAALEISEILVEQGQGAQANEFAVVPDPLFPPTSGAGVGILQQNAALVLDLTFLNDGLESGEAWGTITLRSNDETNREIVVNLKATRTGAPVCDVVLQPASLNYGTVPHGAEKKMTMVIHNIGSGNCSFLRADVSGCMTSMFPGFPATCSPGTASNEFRVVRAPIPIQEGLAPGASEEIQVLFEPPPGAPLIDIFDDYAALLQITMIDPYGPPGADNSFKVPPDPTGLGTVSANLEGRSGISRVSVLPDHIDFGLVTIGCCSQTHRVSVYNSGTAPLVVDEIEPGPECSTEFLIERPPLPAEVTTAQPLIVEVTFHAQQLGEQNCNLIIRSSDVSSPVITVPMEGAGTLETHQIDEFEQVAGQEVDIIFVVDDSGSMCEEQDRMARELDRFINHAQTWGNQYQIGVVSTCVQGDDVCEGAGHLKSKFYQAPDWERWVDNSTWPHFTENVDIGCNGGSDSQEAALEAAHMALSLPIIHLSGTPCGSNADCQLPDICLPNAAVCGGFNGGFLREDAALEIVILSDEEDQSPAPPDFYVDFFKSIKGFANESFLHVHSIVGDRDYGCGDETTSTSADAGDRYIYVSEATGGIVESICNDSFADALSQIGSIAFGLKVQFFLSRSADPSTLSVSVDGVVCTQGWTYDADSNSVIFIEDGPCMPEEGQHIVMEYDAICYNC